MAAVKLAVLLVAVARARLVEEAHRNTATEAGGEGGAGGAATTTGSPTATATATATGVMAFNQAGGMSVDIQGRSGRFAVYNTVAGEGDPKKVVVAMEALREVDAAGKLVGTNSIKRHYLQTFALQDFTFGLRQEGVSLGTAHASKVSFSSRVNSIGVLNVDTFILTQAGAVGSKAETWNAAAGDVKWNIRLSSWSWCGCSNQGREEYGAYIDLEMSVAGLGGFATHARSASNNTYDLGNGVTLELTKKIDVDGEEVEMAAGYPRLKPGSSSIFVLRFPKFQTSALYDPLLRMSKKSEPIIFVNHGAGLAPKPLVLALKALALITGLMASVGAL